MFYYLASVNGGITILRESTENEFLEVQGLIKPISELYNNNSRLDPILKAFDKISTINKSLLTSSKEYTRYDLNEAISNYLFRFRKILDNWETYLKRSFGDNSPQYNAFRLATNESYDNNVEYQIVYQLRNADQHCDNIVTSIQIGIDDDGARYIKAISKCDYLLSIFSNWKSNEKKHLQSLTEIDIFKYISVAHRCILNIHQKALNCLFSLDVYENCCKIVKLSNEYYDKRIGLCFLRQEERLTKEYLRRPKLNLNSISCMVSECVHLLALHIKNNTHSAVVLYYGEIKDKSLEEFVIKTSEEEIEKINVGSIVNVNKWPYRCYSIHAYLDEDIQICIAINTSVPREHEKELADRFSRYVEALMGKD